MKKEKKSVRASGNRCRALGALSKRTTAVIDGLISATVKTFLLGESSKFDNLCYKIMPSRRSALAKRGIGRVFCFPPEKNPYKSPVRLVGRERDAANCHEKNSD